MKLVTTAGSLKSALRIVGHAIEVRSTIPILECVVIDGKKVRATNLDMEIEASFPASTARGSVAILHRPLAKIVGGLPADQVITIEGVHDVTLSFDGGIYTLMTLPAVDHPRLDGPRAKAVPATEQFNKAVRFTSLFVSDEETRYYLNGVCLDGADVIATDGRVLGFVDGGMSFDGQPIIPRGVVKALGKIGDFRSIAIDKGRAAFTFDGVSVRARLIDGKFPDWRRVVPSADSNAPSVAIRRSDLLASLRRFEAFANSRIKSITFALQGDMATITAINPDRGTARERLQSAVVHNANADPVAVSFDIKYLRLLCGAHAQSDTLTFTFGGSDSPCFVTSDVTGFNSVAMPMRGGDDANAIRSLMMLAAPEQEVAA